MPPKKRKLKDALQQYMQKEVPSEHEPIRMSSSVQKPSPTMIPMHIWAPDGQTTLTPFSPSSSKVLLIGEGDFSFAGALTRLGCVKSLVATSLDSSKEVIAAKHPNAVVNLEYLETLQRADSNLEDPAVRIKVLYGVDATRLYADTRIRKLSVANQGFSRIVFNFPHTGSGIKDMARNVLHNQKMLSGFFSEAAQLLRDTESIGTYRRVVGYQTTMIPRETWRPGRRVKKKNANDDMSSDHDSDTEDSLSRGDMMEQPEIHVTLRTGPPYDLWNIKRLAHASGLICRESFRFLAATYEDYMHARTIGELPEKVLAGANSAADSREFLGKPCKTYVFVLKKEDKESKLPSKKRKQ